jgi:hypothetical protein
MCVSAASKGGNMRISGLLIILCAAVLALAPALGSAQINQFEIKEPKVEAGEVEIQVLGDYNFGQPRRRFIEASPGSLLFDANEFSRQRHVLGFGYGLTNWLGLEVQIEAEQERFDDPGTHARAENFRDLKVTEVQIEGTIVLVPAAKHGFGAAFLFEHNIATDRSEADQLFLGTALQYTWGPWSATANIYAVKNFGGREELNGALISDERWDFQYAAQLKYQVNAKLALGLESYGVLERLGNSGTKSEERKVFGDFDRYLLGPVFYYSWGAENDRATKKSGKGLRVRNTNAKNRNGDNDDANDGAREGPTYTLGAGVLFGLNENTADVVLKWNLGVEF